MKRFTALLLLAALLLWGCGEKEPEETTVSGMVVSVEGSTLSLVSMESGSMPSRGENGQRPTMPEGETRPERPEGVMPTLPEGETRPERPEGVMPTLPEGETRPERENGRGQEAFENMETTQIDIANAHITLEQDGGNATGTLEDITRGSFVTITLQDGKATRVVVSQSGFGGKGFGGNFGNRGNRTDRQQNSEKTT